VKAQLDQRFAQLTYEGFWFSPLRLALQAFNDSLAETVTGEVTLKLYKGSMKVVGRSSPHGLYNHALSTYGVEDRFDHRAAEGFIHLLGLQLQEFARQHGGISK
jgi:argininosuccinate synthase